METLSELPRGSFLINTSRGGVVDVLDAITSGHLGGSGIDVLETEPPSAEHPLLQAWRDPAHPAHDRLILKSALRILQRRRAHGYAHQRQRKLPPRPARATRAELGERGDVELGHLPVALSQRR